MDYSNAWVFVSHSNKDYDKIIKVRNKLEALQYKPLLFFLKCLDDDKEIFELIKREIKARDRFVLCKSKNSQESKWVQKEIDFIISLNRPYEIIDLDGTEEEINESIERFNQRSTIYIWSTDEAMEKMVAIRLVKKAFKVECLPYAYLNDYYLFKSGSPYLVKDGFHDIVGNGYVTIIISRKLTEKEALYLNLVAPLFNLHTNRCLLYVISQESMTNHELYYDLQNGDGIQPRIIYQGPPTKRNDSECADKIVTDLTQLDLSLIHI